MENQLDQSAQTKQDLQQNQQTSQLIIPEIIPEKPKANFLLIGSIVIICLFVFGFGGFYFGKQSNKKVDSTVENITSPTSNPVIPPQTTNLSVTPSDLNRSMYTYNTFSFSYPKDWKFISKKDDSNFPLKDRLVFDDEVVAVYKDGVYLIVTISKTGELEAGGIFIDDQEYKEFVEVNDQVVIGEKTFYLAKNHLSKSMLQEAHSGPAMWGALSEYIPSKVTASGNVFKGYEQIIKKNGYMYNFIVLGEKEEITPIAIQSEIKEILETIKW